MQGNKFWTPRAWKIELIQLGITQREFCKMFELDEVQFSNWVNERKQPRKDTAKTINKNINQLKMERKHEVYN